MRSPSRPLICPKTGRCHQITSCKRKELCQFFLLFRRQLIKNGIEFIQKIPEFIRRLLLRRVLLTAPPHIPQQKHLLLLCGFHNFCFIAGRMRISKRAVLLSFNIQSSFVDNGVFRGVPFGKSTPGSGVDSSGFCTAKSDARYTCGRESAGINRHFSGGILSAGIKTAPTVKGGAFRFRH